MKEWFNCPICKQKLVMVDKSKRFEGIYIPCKRCRNEIEIKNLINESEPEPVAKKAI